MLFNCWAVNEWMNKREQQICCSFSHPREKDSIGQKRPFLTPNLDAAREKTGRKIICAEVTNTIKSIGKAQERQTHDLKAEQTRKSERQKSTEAQHFLYFHRFENVFFLLVRKRAFAVVCGEIWVPAIKMAHQWLMEVEHTIGICEGGDESASIRLQKKNPKPLEGVSFFQPESASP